MKKIVVAASSSLLFYLVTPSIAADLVRMPQIATPPPPVPSWTGFYAGANAGYGQGDVSTSENSLTTSGALLGITPGILGAPQTFGGDNRRYSVDGALGGVQIGYYRQFSNIVLGIEADWQAANIHGTDSFDATAAGPFYTGQGNLDWFGTLRGRVGYAFGSWMPYVTGGLAYGHSASTLTIQPGTQAAPRGTPFLANTSAIDTGYAVGGGVEVMLGPSWSVKAEYLRIDLGNNVSTFDYGAAGSTTTRASNPIDIGRGGINLRF